MTHKFSNFCLTKRSIPDSPKRTYLIPACRFKNKISCKEIAATDLNDSCRNSYSDKSRDLEKSTDVEEQLQKMELLAMKLEVERNNYAYYVIFSIAVYFLCWYNFECWAFPFQESPCKQARALPLIETNRSTLADAVDEFVFALQTQIINFHDTVEMSFIEERLLQFTIAKNKIGQLLSQHSADLAAFGALKREDERLEELEENFIGGYLLLYLYVFLSMIFMIMLGLRVVGCKHPEITNKVMPAEENENSQISRLKKLKKRIRFLHIATDVCIVTQFALYCVFIVSIYHGNSPLFGKVKCNATDSCQVQENCSGILSFSDYVSFSTKLNSSLQESCVGIKNSLSSPLLEVRQSVWHYESKAIATAIEHHLHLTKYDVDRRTMPRKVGNERGGLFVNLLIFSILFLLTNGISLILNDVETTGSTVI